MDQNLWKSFLPEVQKIISDDNNWSHDFSPENCANCKKPLGEKVPLHLWKDDGNSMISFHMKCAFGDNVTEADEDEFDLD